MGATHDQHLIAQAEAAYPLQSDPGVVCRAMNLGEAPGHRDALLSALLRLHPELLPARLSNAHPKRKLHYMAGRLCARNALLAAGRTDDNVESLFVLESQEDRSPSWPEGWVGSITHTETLACAAVAPRDLLRSIGIDSETLMTDESARELQDRLAVPSELAFVMEKLGMGMGDSLSLIFSAKESIYKSHYPLVKKYFDFLEARIVGVADGRFQAVLLNDLDAAFKSGTAVDGRFIFRDGQVHTAVELR